MPPPTESPLPQYADPPPPPPPKPGRQNDHHHREEEAIWSRQVHVLAEMVPPPVPPHNNLNDGNVDDEPKYARVDPRHKRNSRLTESSRVGTPKPRNNNRRE